MGKFFSNFYVTAGTSNSVERVWLGWCASMLPHHRTALRKYKYRQTAFLLEGKKNTMEFQHLYLCFHFTRSKLQYTVLENKHPKRYTTKFPGDDGSNYT